MVNSIVNQRGRDGGPPDNGPQQQRMGGQGGQNYVRNVIDSFRQFVFLYLTTILYSKSKITKYEIGCF